MQKFVSRSRVWTCQYERVRSTPFTLRSCFSVFHNVWVHSRPFHYCTKLGAKRAELVQLMQKFMRRSRSGTFLYEHARSTPLDSKTHVLLHFVKFGCIGDRFATALNSCHEVASELFTTNARERHHGTLNSCFVPYRKVWVHSGPFCYYTKLMQKFVSQSRVWTCHYEPARSTQLDPKLMFQCVS